MIHELILLIAVLTVLAIVWRQRRHSFVDELGIEGDLIWIDEGRHTKPFFNAPFKVFGKPDAMYRTRAGVLAVEYKSRSGPIFISDVTQAKCAALAARGAGYKITEVLVKTAAIQKRFTLPCSDHDLYREIEKAVVIARRAKNGDAVPSLPEHRKCQACAYKRDCPSAIA